MKRLSVIALVCLAASCARQNLNYQSQRNSGYPDDRPAAQTYSGGTQNNQSAPPPADSYNGYQQNNNYSGQPQPNYSSPSYQTFYDELSPYGTWVNYGNYGYAWSPNVDPTFAPYSTNGNWIYTNAGWTWNSYYSWGWAPFHYGTWADDPMYGWLWIPGNQWAPAWVTWGQYNGYYGWAPIGPGVGVSESYRPAPQYWTFVPAQNVNQTNVVTYRLDNATVTQNNITVIKNYNNYNNVRYFSGPQRETIEQAGNTQINTVQLNETSKPAQSNVQNNQLNIYRPVINTTSTKAAPAKVASVESLKPAGKPASSSQQMNMNRQPAKPVQQQPATNQQQNNNKPAQTGQQNTQQQKPANGNNNPNKKNNPPKPKPKPQTAPPAKAPEEKKN